MDAMGAIISFPALLAPLPLVLLTIMGKLHLIDPPKDSPEQNWHDRYNAELNDYEDKCREADRLTGDAKQDALAQALAEWQAFLDSKPGRRPAAAVTVKAVDNPADTGTPQPPPEPEVQPTASLGPDLSSSLGHSQC